VADTPKTSGADLRRHRRMGVKVYADLYWEGANRQMNFARGYVLDVSEGGLRLRLPGGNLKTGASVNVRIEQYGFAEYGTVRYASGQGILGIEFRFQTATKAQVERWKKLLSSIHNK
jgi:hypothetical protein